MTDGRRVPRGRRRWVLVAIAAVAVIVVALTAAVVYREVRGSRPRVAPSVPPSPTGLVTPAPTGAAALPELDCGSATTVLGVWAHQDDDLIFAEPDLGAAAQAGDCVRSVFVTAGDAGFGTAYYQSREFGILRAYNAMRGSTTAWTRSDVTTVAGPHLTLFTPQDDPRLTVAFLRLPDGGLDGRGFASTGDQSLEKLDDGAIGALTPLDGYPPVTRPQLVDLLGELITTWHADDVLTLVPVESPLSKGDHPDHSAVGSLAREAAAAVGFPDAQLTSYLGYPSADRPANVAGGALARKLEIYRAYADEDPVVTCTTDAACLSTPGFGEWLQRSYPLTSAELLAGP